MSKLTSEISEQRPPADPEAERWAIGSVILRPSALDDLGFLAVSDFHDENHAALFSAIVDMRRKSEPINAAMLGRRFPGDDWAARIAEIVQAAPHSQDAVYYSRIVSRYAKFRHLREIGLTLAGSAHRAEGEPEEVLERSETELAGIKLADGDGEPIPLADAAVEASIRIDEIQQRGKSAGIPTSLPNFDQDQGGLFPGELTILAARTGLGKTSLALQIASHNANRGRLVYFASLEMSAPELSLRLACGESGVSNRQVRTGRLTPDESARLVAALNRQSGTPLDIHDRSALTVASIRREIRKRVKRGLTLAVVDYLQLVQPEDRRLHREQQVAGIVRALKETAREYDIPILCLCQLNRLADTDDVPRLSQLRESGAIEQDADVVLLLSKHKPTEAEPHNSTLTVAKNRNGETGPLRLEWDGPTTRFSCPSSVTKWPEFAEYER